MSFIFAPTPFYFLRHGVTDHNLRRLVMGQLDIPLNDIGRRQAEAAARVVRLQGIAAIVCSPLSRARETADIIGGYLGIMAVPFEDLRERDWGEMSGRSYRELIRSESPAGAERADAFAERILRAAATASAGATPLLMVAHSGVCRVLRRYFGLNNAEAPVPNGVPLKFLPTRGGGWSETAVVPAPRAGSTEVDPDRSRL